MIHGVNKLGHSLEQWWRLLPMDIAFRRAPYLVCMMRCSFGFLSPKLAWPRLLSLPEERPKYMDFKAPALEKLDTQCLVSIVYFKIVL